MSEAFGQPLPVNPSVRPTTCDSTLSITVLHYSHLVDIIKRLHFRDSGVLNSHWLVLEVSRNTVTRERAIPDPQVAASSTESDHYPGIRACHT